MIALHYHMQENEVEELPISIYRLRQFTIFNDAALRLGMGGFQFQTDDEAINELDEQIEYFTKKGYFK